MEHNQALHQLRLLYPATSTVKKNKILYIIREEDSPKSSTMDTTKFKEIIQMMHKVVKQTK
jgi:hypothetical protein